MWILQSFMALWGSTCLGTVICFSFSFQLFVISLYITWLCFHVHIHRWKDNPCMPKGLIYEGVQTEPLEYSGGALHRAACCTALTNFWGSNMKQKTVCWGTLCPLNDLINAGEEYNWLTVMMLPILGDFLTRMRSYMPPAHKQLIQDISLQPSLRNFVQQQANEQLNQAFQVCVTKLLAFRSYHINVVSRFITVPAARARQLRNQSRDLEEAMISRAPSALEERGTGGSGIMTFLKSVRDQTKIAFLSETSNNMNLWSHHWWHTTECQLHQTNRQ